MIGNLFGSWLEKVAETRLRSSVGDEAEAMGVGFGPWKICLEHLLLRFVQDLGDRGISSR